MKAFHKFCGIVNRILEIVAVVLLTCMIVSLVLQVFTRFVLNNPASWTEAVARYAFIWVIMLGCSMCVANGSHATVSLLNDSLHGNIKKVHKVIIELFVIACAATLMYQAFQLIPKTGKSIIPVLKIPMSYIYAALPVGMAGTILNCVDRILFTIFEEKEEKQA